MKNNQYIRQTQYKKGFASVILIGAVILLVAIGGYFAWSKKANNVVIQLAPAVTYYVGEKPYVQIIWDYSVADYFNIYRSTDQKDWQIISEKYPQSAHAAVDYDFPKDATILYYRITTIDKYNKESTLTEVASVKIPILTSPQTNTSNLKTYTNEKYGYEFSYLLDEKFYVNNEAEIFVSYDNKILMPKTDFGSAQFYVNILSSKTETECRAITYSNPVSGERPPGKKIINGVTFVEGGDSGAAAGTFVQEKIYRAFYNGNCYDLIERLNTFNDLQGLGLRIMNQFEEQTIWNKLDQILSTFKFTK